MNPHYMGVLFRFKVPERIKAQEKETIFVYSEMVHAFSVYFNKNSPGRLPHLRFRVRSLQITEKYNCFLFACLFYINLPSYKFQLLIKVIWL